MERNFQKIKTEITICHLPFPRNLEPKTSSFTPVCAQDQADGGYGTLPIGSAFVLPASAALLVAAAVVAN